MPARTERRGFTYQRRKPEDIKERASAKGGDFDKIFEPEFKVYKVREGKNLIRVLPPTWKDAKHYAYKIWVNYGIGADNQAYLSLAKMLGKKDPLEEARIEADRDGDDDVAKALRPNQRMLIWLIDRMNEDEGPQLWPQPHSFDVDLASACMDEDTKEYFYIDDPEEGHDVRFFAEGQGIKRKYPGAKIKILGKAPIHEDEKLQQKWEDFIADNPLPEVLNFYDYDHISKVFNGKVKTRDEDDGGESKNRRKPRDEDDEVPSNRTRSRVRDEEDEAEEKPRRSRVRDEEDEPPFEKDEEADEKPRRRSRSRAEPEDAEPEDKPRTRSRAQAEPEDEEPDEKPRGRRKVEPEDEEPDEKPRGRRKVEPEDEEPDEKPRGGSIRDRLRARRGASKSDED